MSYTKKTTSHTKTPLPLFLVGFTSLTVFLLTLLSPSPIQAQACYYNECSEGSVCYTGAHYYSPGDYVIDETIDFYTEELKVVPHPDFRRFRKYICRRSGTRYCEIGAVRPCGAGPYGTLMCQCTCNGSASNFEPCNTTGTPSGNWTSVDSSRPRSGRCQDMRADITIAYTPGHIKTQTPYLYNIWQNTVNKGQAIFTPFRSALDKPTFDWPGESNISYEFDPLGDAYGGHAEAGVPYFMYPGWYAKIYFRYLGYIHCAKENVLNKLSSLVPSTQPYIYYDERCNIDLW